MHWSRPDRIEGLGKSRELRCRVPAQVSQIWGRSESAYSAWRKTRPSEFRAIGHKPYALLSQRSLPLLRQEANVGQYVLHFSISELPTPRMHRTEDDTVLDGSQELLI